MAIPWGAVGMGAQALGGILEAFGIGGGPDYNYAVNPENLREALGNFWRVASSGKVPGYGADVVGQRFSLAQRKLAPAFERSRKFALTGARQRLGNQPNVAAYLNATMGGQQTQQLGDIYSQFSIEDETAKRQALRDYLQGYLSLFQTGYTQPQID